MSENNTVAVIGDIHGCINTLEKLHSKLDGTKDIYSVGDLVDRGSYSRDVIRFCINNSIKPVIGNHEDMLIKAIDCSDKFFGFLYRDIELCYYNGGRETQNSYIGSRLYSNFKKFNLEFKASGHYGYIKSLPFKYELKKILISHAGVIDGGNDETIIWNRGAPALLDQLQIFGHTPHKEVEGVKNHYLNIDTGCVYKNKLTAVIVDISTGKIEETIQEKFDPKDLD